jgi:hypothetical protein
MARLFLDANVLFSAAYRSGTGLLKLWKLSEVVLCSSRYALEEARINLGTEVQRTRLERLARKVQLFDAGKHELPERVSLPEKDVPIFLGYRSACNSSFDRGSSALWTLLRQENRGHSCFASRGIPETLQRLGGESSGASVCQGSRAKLY